MNTKTLQFPDSLYTRRDPVSRIKRKVAKGRKPLIHIILDGVKQDDIDDSVFDAYDAWWVDALIIGLFLGVVGLITKVYWHG